MSPRPFPSPASLLLSCVALALAAGCQVGAIGDRNDDPTAPRCDGPLGPPRDPADLQPCCTDWVGGAHCLPAEIVPAELRGILDTCAGGGLCIPDPFIETGGVYEPPTCTSLGDAEGRCLSGCIPQVRDYWGLLPQDLCDSDERCVPCVNPIDGTDTGVCRLAYTCDGGPGGGGDDPPQAVCPHEGAPVIDPSTLPACAPGAHCLSNALIPSELIDRLAACDAQSRCVPDELIASGGNFVPPSCPSVAGAEGRCLSKALPEVQDQAALLPQSTCAATHLCVPCWNPLDGQETGACRLSCDPGPQTGPTQLPACCDGRGTCVPSSAAGDRADQLDEDTCPEGQDLVCAPNVFLQDGYTPPSCTTGLVKFLFGNEYGPGRCLPDCLPAVDNFLLGRDGCDQGFKCAPCLNPLTGQPSGACEL